MMIRYGEIVDSGQGLAHSKEVDISIRQTELPGERSGGAVNADRVCHGGNDGGLGCKRDRCAARPNFGNQAGARGMGVTDIDICE